MLHQRQHLTHWSVLAAPESLPISRGLIRFHGQKNGPSGDLARSRGWSAPADRNGPTHSLSEQPFANFKGVTCLKYGSGVCLDANHLAVLVEAPDVELVLPRSSGETTGHCDGVHGSDVAHVRIIAGLLNLAD